MKASTARRVVAALTALSLATIAACGSSDASTRAPQQDAPTTTAAPVTAPETIPEGTVLRVGDQLNYLATILEIAGEDQDFDYTVEYSQFIGGPTMLQAFQADAIDTGFVGSTPLIFAQAANQDISAIAGWSSKVGFYDIVAAEGRDDIQSVEDLKGRKVAFQRGTAGQAFLLQALEKAGLEQTDIEIVDLPQTQIAQAIQAGSADAGVSIEPLTSGILTATPGARILEVDDEITDRSSFLIASSATLGDSAKTAALADYSQRLIRSFTYLQGHPDQIAEAVYVKTYGLNPERALELAKRGGGAALLVIPDDIAEAQQHLSELYLAAGEIPSEIDVTRVFDNRFEALLKEAAGS